MSDSHTPKIKIEAEVSEAAWRALRAVAEKEGITMEEAAGKIITASINQLSDKQE